MMSKVLLAIVVIDAVAGALFILSRRYALGVGVCGVLVPASVVVAALAFAGAEQQRSTGAILDDQILIVGFAAVVTAVVAALWGLVAGARGVNRRRQERQRESS